MLDSILNLNFGTATIIAIVTLFLYLCYKITGRELMMLLRYRLKGYNIDYYFPFFGLHHLGMTDKRAKGDRNWPLLKAIQDDPEKKYFLSNYFGNPVISLYDDQMISEYFEHYHEYYEKGTIESLERVFGKGILFSEGTSWKKQRKVLSNTFHFDSLKKMCPIVVQSIKENFAELKAQKDLTNVKIMDEFQKITGDIVCRTFFGKDFGKNKIEGRPVTVVLGDFLANAANQAFSLHPMLFGSWILDYGVTENDRWVNRTKDFFRELAIKTINERRQNPQKVFGDDTSRKDFLQVIFEHNEKNPSEAWSDDLIIDQFMTFFIAGMDTTGHALCLAAYYLIKHPECQQEIMKEWKALNKSIDDIATEDLSSLKYLDAFWNETLRLSTPVSVLIHRIAKVDHKLGDVDVLKGMHVDIAITANCHSEKHWTQPEEFRPERWLKPENEKKRGTYAFLPFSGGTHNCIGKYLASIEAKFIILFFLHMFDFELADPNYQLSMLSRFLYEPRDPVKLNLKVKAN